MGIVRGFCGREDRTDWWGFGFTSMYADMQEI